MLSTKEKEILASIVSRSLRASIFNESYIPETQTLKALQKRCGCFVTYKKHGDLRGCIGCFTSQEPLYRCAAEYARLSATEDLRFATNRLCAEDLPYITADVSVLSPLKKCDAPLSIRLGVDGIYIRSGMRSGCFLPQVAFETGWNVEELWSYCCSHKAGLPSDSWKQPGIDLFTFTAEVFEFSCMNETPVVT